MLQLNQNIGLPYMPLLRDFQTLVDTQIMQALTAIIDIIDPNEDDDDCSYETLSIAWKPYLSVFTQARILSSESCKTWSIFHTNNISSIISSENYREKDTTISPTNIDKIVFGLQANAAFFFILKELEIDDWITQWINDLVDKEENLKIMDPEKKDNIKKEFRKLFTYLYREQAVIGVSNPAIYSKFPTIEKSLEKPKILEYEMKGIYAGAKKVNRCNNNSNNNMWFIFKPQIIQKSNHSIITHSLLEVCPTPENECVLPSTRDYYYKVFENTIKELQKLKELPLIQLKHIEGLILSFSADQDMDSSHLESLVPNEEQRKTLQHHFTNLSISLVNNHKLIASDFNALEEYIKQLLSTQNEILSDLKILDQFQQFVTIAKTVVTKYNELEEERSIMKGYNESEGSDVASSAQSIIQLIKSHLDTIRNLSSHTENEKRDQQALGLINNIQNLQQELKNIFLDGGLKDFCSDPYLLESYNLTNLMVEILVNKLFPLQNATSLNAALINKDKLRIINNIVTTQMDFHQELLSLHKSRSNNILKQRSDREESLTTLNPLIRMTKT